MSSPTAVLPAGAVLVVDERSWSRDEDLAGVDVTMTVPGRRPERLHVTLVLEDGRWRILSTEP